MLTNMLRPGAASRRMLRWLTAAGLLLAAAVPTVAALPTAADQAGVLHVHSTAVDAPVVQTLEGSDDAEGVVRMSDRARTVACHADACTAGDCCPGGDTACGANGACGNHGPCGNGYQYGGNRCGSGSGCQGGMLSRLFGVSSNRDTCRYRRCRHCGRDEGYCRRCDRCRYCGYCDDDDNNSDWDDDDGCRGIPLPYLCGIGRLGGNHPVTGCYKHTYAVNPYYHDFRDGSVYAAQGYNAPIAVPLAPNVDFTMNYGWGIPSSRLTPTSRVLPSPYAVQPSYGVPSNGAVGQ